MEGMLQIQQAHLTLIAQVIQIQIQLQFIQELQETIKAMVQLELE
jgi:hypothetical protein